MEAYSPSASSGRIYFLAFSNFQKPPKLLPSIFKASNLPLLHLTSASILTFSFYDSELLAPLQQGSCNYIGPMQIIENNASISELLYQLCSQNPPFQLTERQSHRFPGTRTWRSSKNSAQPIIGSHLKKLKRCRNLKWLCLRRYFLEYSLRHLGEASTDLSGENNFIINVKQYPNMFARKPGSQVKISPNTQ